MSARHPQYAHVLREVQVSSTTAESCSAVPDVAAWSRLTGLREVVDRIRPRLITFRDEHGRELFDLPVAPRPDPETPAPPRFLPEHDNILLSHADRSRVRSEEHRARLSRVTGPVHGSVLHDGFLWGVWRLEREREAGSATLVIDHVQRLTKRAGVSLAAEGRRLLQLIAADFDSQDVRFVAVD